ncbi:MAG TPA: hypothetical protein VH482_11515 [Thermomicrobiales bacterium]|jgi:hypothetical protein
MAPRWHRIEHRTGDVVTPLGRVADLARHRTTLAPFVSRLLLDGQTGVVVLVDEATGADVARHDLRRGPQRAPTHGRGGWGGSGPGPRRRPAPGGLARGRS